MKNSTGKKLLILIILCLSSCQFDKDKFIEKEKASHNSNQELLENQLQKPWEKIYFRGISERIKGTTIVNLRDLEVPPNSKQIRIWSGFDTSPLRGVILKQQEGDSSATFLPPIDSSNPLPNPKPLLPPKNGWEAFWLTLDNLDIQSLPDPMDIADIDGGTVIVEIKNGDKYRNYKYSSLDREKGENYQKLRKICETVSNEFGIELLKYFKPINTKQS